MSSPSPGINLEPEEPFSYLDASLEDLGNLWELLDDQDHGVAQPESSSVSVGIHGANENYSLSDVHLQAIVQDRNISCVFPHDHGSGPPLLTCLEDNADSIISMSHIEKGKGKGKAVQTVSLESGREVGDGVSRRTGPVKIRTLDKDGEEGSVMKKQDHNAKERSRRMKLSFMPGSR
ncbi:hypothetical protein SAY87_001271 [Trapa incisa]|uniref:Uncharacterized protein n=1 Tax=Trapa incisa TaxID=236973 RepID=A0AAN7GCY8_9MYRT|nr:hypothetical protein SAY87_001271 [Trapa incisa]